MDVLEPLKNFFAKFTAVPITEWAYFCTQIRIHQFKKGELLFRSGEYSDLIGYVVKGLVYTYYVTDQGQLYVKNFAWEGQLISPYVSILNDQPSNFSAEALEETTVVAMTGATLKELHKRHHCWNIITRKAAESLLAQREKREFESLVLDNLQRYESFQKEFPAILHRIPQHIIAGYLGINPVSLSRLLQKK